MRVSWTESKGIDQAFGALPQDKNNTPQWRSNDSLWIHSYSSEVILGYTWIVILKITLHFPPKYVEEDKKIGVRQVFHFILTSYTGCSA
jgi:hypothetical protein